MTNELFDKINFFQPMGIDSNSLFKSKLDALSYVYVLDSTTDYLNNYQRSSVQYFDNEVLVEVEVPRFKRNEINLLLKDEFLTVEGVRKTADDGQNTFIEKIWVGKYINSDTVSARLSDGVLYVTLLKTEQSKGKQILISE